MSPNPEVLASLGLPVKRCQICGDVAIGFNYSALTCRSCKVFFYRYEAVKNFKCRNLVSKENPGQECEITVDSRSRCKKCRLDKCYRMGMQKMLDSNPSNDSHSNSNSNSSEHSVNSPTNSSSASSNNSMILRQEPSPLRTLLEVSCALADAETVANFDFATEISTKFTKTFKHQSPLTLSAYEQAQICRVQNAIESSFASERDVEFGGEISNFDAFKRMLYPDMYARRIVNFAKGMIEFRTLNPGDQLIVLRKFVMDILSVWNAFLWDDQSKGFLIMEHLGSHSLRVTFKMEELTEYHTEENKGMCQITLDFFHNLQHEMEDDLTIRDLIIALLLFYPHQALNEVVSSREFLNYQYFLYCHLLKRYLTQKYRSTARAHKKFASIMELLTFLTTIKQNMRILTYELCHEELPELMREAYI